MKGSVGSQQQAPLADVVLTFCVLLTMGKKYCLFLLQGSYIIENQCQCFTFKEALLQESVRGELQDADDGGSEQDWTSEAGLTPDSTAHTDHSFAR